MSEFMIGTTYGGMTALDELTTPVTDPKSNFMPYARVSSLANGGTRGLGFPIAIWDFSLITLAERNQLKEFCSGASATVYIHTKINDDSFADFSVKMIWPDGIEDRWYGEKKNFTIQFRNLVLIEGS